MSSAPQYDLPALLGVGGDAREFMRAAPNGGDWVDAFCDCILKQSPAPDVAKEDLTAVEHLLQNPSMLCTSLNFSRIAKTGLYRITMMRVKSSVWLTGQGETFSDAVLALQQEVDLET